MLTRGVVRFAIMSHRKQDRIVAECGAANHIDVMSVARYDASQTRDPQRAEFAIVVEDRFQGQGLGKVLLRALADAARANGTRYLGGSTLADNQNMLRFLRGCGYPVEFHRDGTEMNFVLDVGSA